MTPDFDLSRRTTFGLTSRARFGGEIHNFQQLHGAIALSRDLGLPLRVLGGGSNCILSPQLIMANRRCSTDHSNPDAVYVTAAAGEPWPDLVAWTVSKGIGGLENLADIPSTVGAAPIQNIGAYGVELSDLVDRVMAFDLDTDKIVTFDAAACRIAYRDSLFKSEQGRFVITELRFVLPLIRRPVLGYAGLTDLPEDATPDMVMTRVVALRRSKLPDWRVTGNAGSYFKNPAVKHSDARTFAGLPQHPTSDGIKLSAAALLEACGMKGQHRGGAAFSPDHALIMINRGSATFDDVAALTQDAVRTKFGVTMEQEPMIY